MSALATMKSINPMGVMDGFVSLMGFNQFHHFLNSMMERNMANNFTALGHAGGSSMMALGYLITGNTKLYYFLKKFSTGYFLYDTIHSAKYLKYPLNTMYMYHHLSTIYYLHQNPEIYKTGQIMFLAEL